LQTERDKARVMEGLEGVGAGDGGGRFDKGRVEKTLAGLESRIFLMHNVHEDAPVVFESRWALSYLRGPLTRSQIKTLMDPVRSTPVEGAGGRPAGRVAAGVARGVPAPTEAPSAASGVPPDVPVFYVPTRGSGPSGANLVYRPMAVGAAKVGYVDKKANVDFQKETVMLAPILDQAIPVDWDGAHEAGFEASELEKAGDSPARFAGLPGPAAKASSTGVLPGRWLFDTQRLMMRSPGLGVLSLPDEDEREFRIRLQQLARERRDEAVEKLRSKYTPKLTSLQDRVRRAEQAVMREAQQAEQQKAQTVISFGSTILGAFVGRKALSATTLGRATTAARGVSRSIKEKDDIARAEDNLKVLKEQLQDLEAEFKVETKELEAAIDPTTEELEAITLKPRKSDVTVELIALAWSPYWEGAGGEVRPAWG
jgi:hypothetical protein